MSYFMTCTNKECGKEFIIEPYIKLNTNVALDKARETNAFLPRYEIKMATDCSHCGRFQKWLTQEPDIALNHRFYQGQPKKDHDGFARHTAHSHNVLEVRVKAAEGPHGDLKEQVTTVQLVDQGGTNMKVDGQYADRVELSFIGNAERTTLIECLEFAAKTLKESGRAF